jgi:hypothetical protein
MADTPKKRATVTQKKPIQEGAMQNKTPLQNWVNMQNRQPEVPSPFHPKTHQTQLLLTDRRGIQ